MNYYWEIETRTIVRSLTDARAPLPITIPARDILPTSIAVVSRSVITEPFVAGQLGAGESILYAAKTGIGANDYLFYEDTFVFNEDEDAPRYQADVNLNMENLINALLGKKSLFVQGELTILKADNHYNTTFIRLRILNDIIDDGTAPEPATHNPKVINGIQYIWNETTQRYHGHTVVGEAGHVRTIIDQVGIE